MPTILTILSAIMYLRLGWLVGNAGLLGAFAVIALSLMISTATALSVASIATNVRVRHGGPFSLISQSLGLEVGGAVGLPFFIAQSISIAFYIFAFAEGWTFIFPQHHPALVLGGVWFFAFVLTWSSMNVVTRAQFVILGVQVLSLLSIFLGSFPIGKHEGFHVEATYIGGFEDGSFSELMAVFFSGGDGRFVGCGLCQPTKKSAPQHSTRHYLCSYHDGDGLFRHGDLVFAHGKPRRTPRGLSCDCGKRHF